MPDPDIEDQRQRVGTHTDTSSETSETLEAYSERISLLAPHATSPANYKSIDIIKTTTSSLPNDEDAATGSVENEESARQRPKNVISILSLLLLGVFISNADGSLVMATYTTISSQFHSFSNAAWLTTSYTLASCAFQPIVGKLSDIYGRKPVLLISYAIFGLGSIATGAAQSMEQAVLGRVVGGVSSAGMMVIVAVLITDLVPLLEVAAWRSYVNVVATLGRAMGGPLGGWLADTIGWRWSFMGQGPVMVVAILVVGWKLPAISKTDGDEGGLGGKGQPSKLRRIDFVGAGMLASTTVAFLMALSLGGQDLPWSHPVVIGLLLGSVVLGGLFVLWEVRYAFEPVFPPSLVVQRDIATPYAIMGLQTAAQLAMMFSVPLYFRVTENASNTAAGSHLFPAVLGNTVGGLLSGFTIQRTGKYKFLTIIATISSSFTYFLLIVRWTGKISLLESLEIIPGGFGTGMAAASTFIALTSSVEHSQMAVVTGGMYLSGAIGMLFGLASSSSVQVSTLKSLLARTTLDRDVIERVTSNVEAVWKLEPDVREIVVDVYVKSLEYSHMVSLGCALLALVLALTIRENKLK